MAAAATAAAAAVTAASAEAEARVKKEDGIRCRASSATKQQQKQKAAAPASATASSSCSSIDRQANGTDLPLPLAASSNGSSTTTQQQQQQPEHDDEPCDEEFFDVADPDPQTVQSDAAADAGSTAGTFVAGSSAAGSHSTAGGSVARDSPHLLFLNHVKKWWIDLSADKKTLKLEGKGEEDELEEELALAMERWAQQRKSHPSTMIRTKAVLARVTADYYYSSSLMNTAFFTWIAWFTSVNHTVPADCAALASCFGASPTPFPDQPAGSMQGSSDGCLCGQSWLTALMC
jgi:hypothetical protein